VNTYSGLFATVLSVAGLALVPGCAVSSAPSPEGVASTDEPIENGQPINSGADPFSTPFATPTVGLQIVPPGAAAGTADYCTGVIISATQVLTAAHCVPTGSVVRLVYQYGTFGATPPAPPVLNVTSSSIAMPGNIANTGCANGASYPDGCQDAAGNFADLAIITLPFSFNSASHGPVAVGIANSFSSIHTKSAWEVGIGNLAPGASLISNSPTMEWVPVDLPSNDQGGFIAPGSTSLYTERPGAFVTRNSYADHGDSGGPVYQLDPLWQVGEGPPRLILIGITSGQVSTSAPGTRFTSVLRTPNYNWITTQLGGTPLFIRESELTRVRLGLDVGLDPSAWSAPMDHTVSPFDGL
jgi:hypothetical protein